MENTGSHNEEQEIDSNITRGQKAAFKKLFNHFKEEVKKEFEKINDDIKTIAQFKLKYIDGTETEKSVQSKIDLFSSVISTKYSDTKAKHEEIVKLYDELFKGTSTTDPINETLTDLVTESETKVQEIENKKKELEAFYEKVFGKEINTKDPNSKAIEGYTHKFDRELKKVTDFLKNQQERFDAQFEVIKSLLPGATSIGLAKAFEDQKKSYTLSITIWSCVFVVTMLGMLSFGIYYIVEIAKITDLDVSKAFIALLNKLPFFVPTIWLAVFASKQQSQNKRLQQEYAFKETFAKSYDGQKTQLEKLDLDPDEENGVLKKLLENLVMITSHNPSDSLESEKHNEKVPLMQTLEKIIPKIGKDKNSESK